MPSPPAAPSKVILDTNVFIDYLRAGRHADWVAGRSQGLVRFLSAVVLLELRLGARTPRRRRAVDRLRAAFPPGRTIVPSAELFDRAGRIFPAVHGDLAVTARGDRLGDMNDLLIALSAWRLGATIVTSNEADFARLAAHLPGLSWRPPG